MAAAENLGPVLVTGAARRIGLALAQAFAHAGHAVVLHASERSLVEAEQQASAMRDAGMRAAALGADLGHNETQKLISHAADCFGPLTLLVNSASIFETDTAQDFALARLERHMAVNLRAPLILSQAFAAQSPRGVERAIINIIDQRVLRPSPNDFTYTLSKTALWAATRTMAQAFAPHVRVNAIGPGPVFPNTQEGEAGFAAEVASLPLAHATAVGSVVEAALYLSRARDVTGQMIAVDGGQHLAWRMS